MDMEKESEKRLDQTTRVVLFSLGAITLLIGAGLLRKGVSLSRDPIAYSILSRSNELGYVGGGVIFSSLGATTLFAMGGTELGYYLGNKNSIESLNALELELAIMDMIKIEVKSFVEKADNVTTSLNNLSNEWDTLQSNIHTMADVMGSEDLDDLQPQFVEASIAWGNTQNVSEVYQQLEENTVDPVEIDLDGIETEEEYEEALKEAYGVDELIDPSDLTDEELEELLRDLLEEELEESA